jgi:RNA polymerase sigma-70 factor (ECF subfamily)
VSAGATTADDSGLLARLARGDRAALGELWDRHAAATLGLLVQILGRGGEAEEVLQETFLQAWQQAGRFDPSRGTARGWLVVMARSRALDRLRSTSSAARRELAVGRDELLVPSATDPPGRRLEDRERRAGVLAALDDLPPEQRECLLLAFFAGLTHAEIAARLDAPLGTVKSRILLAMRKLRPALAPYR